MTAKDVMENGKEMLTQKDLADYSMKRMEGLYEHIRGLLAELDEQFAKEVQFEDYFKDLNKTIITTLIEARINLEDIAHYSTMNILVDIEKSFEARLSKFDSWLSWILKQEGKIESDELKDIIKKLSHEYLEFKQLSLGLIAAQKELVNIKSKSDNAIKRLDEAKENILLILMKAAGEAEKGVKKAQATINATQISAKFVLILTAGIGTILGIIFGILYSRQITSKLKQLVEATRIISAEDMEHKVAVSSRDEIGTLAISFNKMIADLQKTTVSKYKLEKVVKERTKELETTYKQLIQAEKLSAVGKLAASIAHEFNNPIYGIRNVLERFADRASDVNMDEAHKDLVALAITECDRVANLIQKLQDFHRPSSGIAAPFNIHEAIDDMIRMTEKKLKEKKIKLKTHYADDIPPIVAVSDQIRQVILNLLQNAMGAITEEGGKIAITTQRDGSCIKIYVQDTGCGILTENMKSIFEPFFTTKASVKGTGLGLSVSYGIVKKHGGNIEIQSLPGKGTIFTVTLPINGVTK
jgi:C4-dicarboxylate-specific signal transduction histidine kinase